MYIFPHTIGASSSKISDEIDLTRPRAWMYATLDVHIILLWLLRGWRHKTGKIPNLPNMMIPNHHKRKHGSNMAKKTVARTRPKNLKLNVEDHIASTPIGPRKKTYHRVYSWYSAANPSLLLETILQSIGVWDQVCPYRHVDVRNISLGERDYKPVP